MGGRGTIHFTSTVSSDTTTIYLCTKVATEHPVSQVIVMDIRDQSQNVK
jgi:hypothetical protein